MRKTLLLSSLFFLGACGCGGGNEAVQPPNPKGTGGVEPLTISEAPDPGPPAPEIQNVTEPINPPKTGELLRVTFGKGEKIERIIYSKIRLEQTGQKAAVEEVSMTVKVEGIESTANGSKVRLVSTGTSSKSGGQSSPINLEMFVNNRGSVVDNNDNPIASAASVLLVPFPISPVVAGTSWTVSSKRDVPSLGLIDYVETYTYRGKTVKSGKSMWEIQVAAKGGAALQISGTYWVDCRNGRMHSGEIKMSAFQATGPKAVESVAGNSVVSVTIKPARGN